MSETVFYNGTIIPLSRTGARAEAVLVRDDMIVAVGNSVKVLKMATAGAQRIDLGGRTLVPGFNDDHIHVAGMGNHFSTPNLSGMSKVEIVEYLAELYPEPRSREPIIAVQWDYPYCPDPHARDLDRVFKDTPVMLVQYSGHAVWVNSAALKLVGIDESTRDWPSGGPVRDSAGHLTGILREPHGHPRYQKVFRRRQFDPASMKKAIPVALKVLTEHGFTSVQDNTWIRAGANVYKELHRRNELNVRLSCWSLGEIPWPYRLQMERGSYNADWYHLGPRKYFFDGAFSSRTAYLMEPYADEPDTRGKGKSPGEILEIMTQAARIDKQLACHSIGDRSTMQFCDGTQAVAARYPRVKDRRWRIEHGQLIRQEDIRRIVDLGIVVSAQAHALTSPDKDKRLLGEQRAEAAYPYRSLIDAGAHLAFGSDFPGEGTFNPLLGIHLVVNREGPEAITAEEALYCYTAGSAYAEFEEARKGTIEPGKFADFAVLSEDPTTVKQDAIRDIKVDMTIVGGRVVYERPDESTGSDAEDRLSTAGERRQIGG